MVSDEDLRKLKSLADQYHISQKLQSDSWPPALEPTFQCIKNLSQTTFQAYSDGINGRSENEPWRRQNKARAEWLVEQAGRLSKNPVNESAWRMRIENAILERFSVEVACPICKYRLWRSEVESIHTGSSHMWAELDQRRLTRGPCKCSLEDRPQDRYEVGTSRLFEDRVEELVIHDVPLGELPKQKPDRIVGLRETKNIRRLLDQPPQFPSVDNARNVRELVRCSPFRWQSDPLLFPFLVLEAKSDTAQNSFSDIQTQTAFPIWSLLNLQRDLQSFRPSDSGRPEPLVWFLGYRGGDWKLYGCYVGLNSESNPAYNVHYLRGGDIATKDGALQLLLLIDYIMDWARDIFRPSIIAQLSSLATGNDFDEVSLGPDSDILSRERTVRDWMSRVASTVVQDDAAGPSGNKPIQPDAHDNFLAIRPPNTELGVVRSVSTTTLQLAGLRVTEGNVESLMALSDAPGYVDALCQSAKFSHSARKLLNEITRWDEVLVVLGADLDNIERMWTGEEKMPLDPFDEGPGAEFYAIFEYRCFFNVSWEIVRELSYLAISKAAFDVLEKHAAFLRRHPGIDAFPKTLRPCSGALIEDAIDCLHSGSPWQVLLSAISSTLLSLCPEPERRREDFPPSVVSLGFGYPGSIRVRLFIEEFMKIVDKSPPRLRKNMENSERHQKRYKEHKDGWEGRTCNRSFRRMSRRVVQVSENCHDSTECTRCKSSGQDLFGLKYWDEENIPSPTAYGAILVASLKDGPKNSYEKQPRHDLGLFVFENSSWMEDELAVSVVVDDLAQNDIIYHTIQHEPPTKVDEPRAVLWNLPSPYRRSTQRQRWDIARWVGELNGQLIPDPDASKQSILPWVHQQMLLHFLRNDMASDDALAVVTQICDQKIDVWNERAREEGREITAETIANCVGLWEFWHRIVPRNSPRPESVFPEKLRLRGD